MNGIAGALYIIIPMFVVCFIYMLSNNDWDKPKSLTKNTTGVNNGKFASNYAIPHYVPSPITPPPKHPFYVLKEREIILVDQGDQARLLCAIYKLGQDNQACSLTPSISVHTFMERVKAVKFTFETDEELIQFKLANAELIMTFSEQPTYQG